jgi:hypothetical protein
MMQQYVLATPLLAILDLWASLSLPPPSAASTRASCLAAKRLSTLLALWALFSLYQATHDALSTWNTTGKFVALKAVLMLELLQVSSCCWPKAWGRGGVCWCRCRDGVR